MLMCSLEASEGSGFVPDKPGRAETERVGAASRRACPRADISVFASETILTNTWEHKDKNTSQAIGNL